MVLDAKSIGVIVVRLMVGIALLSWPRIGSAAGTWSVIASKGDAPGQVSNPIALAAGATGNLYVADSGPSRLQKRDTQGNWSDIINYGRREAKIAALAVDTTGNLYVGGYVGAVGSLLKRDRQGKWSSILNSDHPRTFVYFALAVDIDGNLYAAGDGYLGGDELYFIEKWDDQGNDSILATEGTGLGQVNAPSALAVDAAGNLYVADRGYGPGRIQKRDVQGNWSVIATEGMALGQVNYPTALAEDGVGSLYVADGGSYDADGGSSRIQKRNAQGNWSEIATGGQAIGQVHIAPDKGGCGLAVDEAGNLYVADTGNNRVQVYVPAP